VRAGVALPKPSERRSVWSARRSGIAAKCLHSVEIVRVDLAGQRFLPNNCRSTNGRIPPCR
jgi:hypothetical protein